MAIRSNLTDLRPARERLSQQITLLSHGYSCPTAFPDGKITVYPWDPDIDAWAVERSAKGMKNFMWDLLAKICDLNGCPLERFVVGDVSTVMLVSRALAHDHTIVFVAQCPQCSFEQRSQVRVPDQLERLGEKTDKYPGYDEITLPECKDVVKLRPLLVGDVTAIENRSERERKVYPDRFCRVLVPVVDINSTTPDTFAELATWYEALGPKDKRYLHEQQDLLYPHLKTELDWKCDQCAHEFSFPLVFNEKFFRDDVGREARRPLAPNGPAST